MACKIGTVAPPVLEHELSWGGDNLLVQSVTVLRVRFPSQHVDIGVICPARSLTMGLMPKPAPNSHTLVICFFLSIATRLSSFPFTRALVRRTSCGVTYHDL